MDLTMGELTGELGRLTLRERSYHLPQRLGRFVLMAIIIHIAVLWWGRGEQHSAQLTQQMQIRLQASIVNVPNESTATTMDVPPVVKKVIKPKSKPIVKQKVVTQPDATTAHMPKLSEVEPQEETETVEKKTVEHEEAVAPPAASFVEANNQPYQYSNPKPYYPRAARKRGMQGLVLLDVAISAEGQVTEVVIQKSCGFRSLDLSAQETVRQWRFMPATRGGEAVASRLTVPVRFILNEQD